MKLRYTPAAIQDLTEIKAYITDILNNPEAAKSTIQKITCACSKLKTAPRVGGELSKKLNREIRGHYLITGNYIVLYEIGEAISIIRVLDTRTDYLGILLSELQ